MFPGETPVDSCMRLLKREMGLDIDRCRFVPICAQAFAFGMREQSPKDHGTTDVQLCYFLKLEDDKEVGRVVLDPNEYADGRWILPDEILDGNYHPALKYAVGSMLATDALADLERCEREECTGGGSDEELARLTRIFLRRRTAVNEMMTSGKNDYVLDSRELDYRTTVRSKF